MTDFQKFNSVLVELCRDFSVPVPALEMSKRLSVSAGIWYPPRPPRYPRGVIRLSQKNLDTFGYETMLGTLKHEFVHHCMFFQGIQRGLTVKQAYDQTQHSYEFKQFCAKIGGTMNPTMAGVEFAHIADDSFLQSEFKWTYRCKCGGGYSHNRRRYSERELKKYECTACHTPMTAWERKKYDGSMS